MRIGTFKNISIAQESFQAYIPAQLPPELELAELFPAIERATLAISQLNATAKMVPNISLFIYMYVRKEALLSSQIEGTQSSFSDLILFEHDQETDSLIDDVEEVSNYVAAVNYATKRLDEDFPLSLRLLKETHAILLRGGRGSKKEPGEFRKSQNWIGGTRPGNALFVPPPVEELMPCLDNFEKFLHGNKTNLPALIRIGLAHFQFETIHPFLDGNGRLGRLLISLMLREAGMLEAPILYLSLYLKKNRQLYYDLLQEVRLEGSWETWLEFFLTGINETANQATNTIIKMAELFDKHEALIARLGRQRLSCAKVFHHLQKLPYATVKLVADELKITAPTARAALNQLVNLGIIQETSGKARNKVYCYKNYVSLLEEGTEPL